MSEQFKLKKDGKRVGYYKIEDGIIYISYDGERWEEVYYSSLFVDSNAHPFATTDKHGEKVFAGDEVTYLIDNKRLGPFKVCLRPMRVEYWLENEAGDLPCVLKPEYIELIKEKK